MLTHTQIKTLRMIRNRGDSILSKLPRDIIRHISRMNTTEHVVTDTAALLPYVIGIDGQPVQRVELLGEQPRLLLEPSQMLAAGTLLSPSNVVIGRVLPKNIIRYIRQINSDENGEPVSEIGQLLKYIADGNPVAARKMLENNPRLLFQAGDVIAPSGDLICRVSPYELALCIGDHHPDMIPMIAAFFVHPSIKGGEAERQLQYARYQDDIDNMLNQKPYDFSWMIEVIKASTPDEVIAALYKDIEHGGALCDALAKFREEFSPRIVTKGLLFNYATLHEAFKVFTVEFKSLHSHNNFNKVRLVWRQVIGRIVDLLPACERQAFATCYLSKNAAVLERSFKLIYGSGNFPFAANDDSRSGAGWDFSCDVNGCVSSGKVAGCECTMAMIEKLISNKRDKLAEYMQSLEKPTPSPCVIC
jgi:hypothetical protein